MCWDWLKDRVVCSCVGDTFPDNVERMSGFGCYAEFLFINQCGKGMRDGDS